MVVTRPEHTDPGAPLWRAAQAFRLVTLVYAIVVQLVSVQYYSDKRLSWLFIALMVVWSGASALWLSRSAATRLRVVIADQVVVIGLMFATRLVSDYDWYTTHQTLPTTLWATNAVISAAILGGPVVGVAAGVLIAAVSVTVRDQLDPALWTDGTAPILVATGLALGLAASTARRAQRQVERAARLTAATEARERLAREVHDGVLQVLAYVRRRGNEIGGETRELADKAGAQEIALRMLISEQATDLDAGDSTVDLCSLLRAQGSSTVSVSTPGEPVVVGRWVASEISAATATALSNVALHAGPDAKAYVLLEDLGDAVIVSVRDDGVGIPTGRLAQAESEGRMGVSKSIRGRIDALGGDAALLTAPGDGTEWEFRVPISNRGGI